MRQLPSGTCLTTTTFKRGQPAQALHLLERDAASEDVIEVPKKETDNKKTLRVYMSVKLVDGWITSDQTGVLPRVSSRGNNISVCFTSTIPTLSKELQSSHATDLISLGHTNLVYKWCECRGFKPALHRMGNETL